MSRCDRMLEWIMVECRGVTVCWNGLWLNVEV